MPNKISIARFLTLSALALLICSCSPSSVVPSLAGSWEYNETGRIKSPDAVVEAVLLTGNAGATTAAVTYLYIVPAGGRANPNKDTENDACFAADHVKDLRVAWKSLRLLEIQYVEARIHHFQNIWYHRDVQDFHYVVEIRLAPTGTEFSLPAKDRN